MIRWIRLTALVGCLGALATSASASIIHHAPLEQVLGQADWVIVATVEKTEVREDAVHKLYTWSVRRERVLRGDASLPDLPLMYSHRWPILRNEQGETIGTISPIYDGSGLEHDVREGQTWIFMGKAPASDGAEVLFVDRVEPLAVEPQILSLLNVPAPAEPITDGGGWTPYSPPRTRPGEDGWLLYQGSPTWDASTAVDLRPGNGSAEAAVVHYLASRVRGDRRFDEVLPAADNCGGRLTRALSEHDSWTFHAFRLVGRKELEPGALWIKIWMQISFEGDMDSGEDEFSVLCTGDACVVTDVPT